HRSASSIGRLNCKRARVRICTSFVSARWRGPASGEGRQLAITLRVMPFWLRSIALCVLCALCVLGAACGNTTLFHQYEYDEDVYLSLDGSAAVYVNASLAALNALRGARFDASPDARFDAAAVQAFYAGPEVRVTRVTQSRRNSRRFAHVRLEV